MYVLIVLINKLIEKDVMSYDEAKSMFIELESIIQSSDVEGAEKTIPITVLKRFQKILFSEP